MEKHPSELSLDDLQQLDEWNSSDHDHVSEVEYDLGPDQGLDLRHSDDDLTFEEATRLHFRSPLGMSRSMLTGSSMLPIFMSYPGVQTTPGPTPKSHVPKLQPPTVVCPSLVKVQTTQTETEGEFLSRTSALEAL